MAQTYPVIGKEIKRNQKKKRDENKNGFLSDMRVRELFQVEHVV
jgi:hypothetical protein